MSPLTPRCSREPGRSHAGPGAKLSLGLVENCARLTNYCAYDMIGVSSNYIVLIHRKNTVIIVHMLACDIILDNVYTVHTNHE